MRLVIDIPDEEYERWKTVGEMDAFIVRKAMLNGTPLPKGHGFIAICDSDEELSEQAIQELKNTVFVGDEKCSYCFDIVDIIKADTDGKGQDV